jgi:uncharacterized protein (TIGR03437 family)
MLKKNRSGAPLPFRQAGQRSRKMRLISLLVLASAAVATGQATYSYTGNSFNSVAYWPQSYPSPGTHVTAVITLPMALPKGATTCIASRAPACSNPVMNLNGFSWDISDGVNTIANIYPDGTSGAVLNSLTFTTDSNGNIINWDIDASNGTYSVLGAYSYQILEIRTVNEPSPGFENDSDVSSVGAYLDSISANPGTWKASDPAGPVVVGGAGDGSIAAGGLATIYGSFTGFATESGLATSLAGVQVTFPGVVGGGAPLLYVSPTQVTFQVPWEFQKVTDSGQTPLSVSLNGQPVASLLLSPLPAVAPGVFEMNAQGQAAALDGASHLIGLANPASAGAVVSIYCTGLGPVNVPQTDGVPAPLDQLVYTDSTPAVTIGGENAEVVFSGLAPGSTGLYQINVVVPNVPAGTQPVTVTLLNVASNTTTLAVQ